MKTYIYAYIYRACGNIYLYKHLNTLCLKTEIEKIYSIINIIFRKSYLNFFISFLFNLTAYNFKVYATSVEIYLKLCYTETIQLRAFEDRHSKIFDMRTLIYNPALLKYSHTES